jgi:hypothetical protein
MHAKVCLLLPGITLPACNRDSRRRLYRRDTTVLLAKLHAVLCEILARRSPRQPDSPCVLSDPKDRED